MPHCPSKDTSNVLSIAALPSFYFSIIWNTHYWYFLVLYVNNMRWDQPNRVLSTVDGFVINQSPRRQQLYNWHTGLKQLGVWPPASPPILPQEAAFPLPVACVFSKYMVLVCVTCFVVASLCHMFPLDISNIFFLKYGNSKNHNIGVSYSVYWSIDLVIARMWQQNKPVKL